MFEMAIGTALSVISVFWWIGFHRIAKVGLLLDISTWALLAFLFEGTYAGMMTGMLGALFVSVFLRVNRMYWTNRKPETKLATVVAQRKLLGRLYWHS